jgi:predicted DNA-binding protein
MQAFTLTNELETRLGLVAERQGKSIDQILNELVAEYLEDLDDALSAEAVLERIESGDTGLVDWQEAKRELHGLDH